MHAIHPIRPVIGQANLRGIATTKSSYMPSHQWIYPSLYHKSTHLFSVKSSNQNPTRTSNPVSRVCFPARACSEMDVVATGTLWFSATPKTVQQFCC